MPSRKPIGLYNLGNSCYLNSILQILFQLNHFGFYDRWINHVLSLDKTECTDYNKLPNVDISTHFHKETYEEKCITCSKCAVQSNHSICITLHEKPKVLLIQVNRFSYSCINNRPRKNNQLFGIHEDIKLGLVKYKLLGFITHQGVFTNSGHYVNWVRYITNGIIAMIILLKTIHCSPHPKKYIFYFT